MTIQKSQIDNTDLPEFRARIVVFAILAGISLSMLVFQSASSSNSSLIDGNEDFSSSSDDFKSNQTVSAHESLSGRIEGNGSVSISDNKVSVDLDSSSQAEVKQSDSSISIRIESSSSSSVDPDTSSPEPSEPASSPSLVINGEEVEIPKNGRINQTEKDENTKTRLRADIDGGSSSINISTKTTE